MDPWWSCSTSKIPTLRFRILQPMIDECSIYVHCAKFTTIPLRVRISRFFNVGFEALNTVLRNEVSNISGKNYCYDDLGYSHDWWLLNILQMPLGDSRQPPLRYKTPRQNQYRYSQWPHQKNTILARIYLDRPRLQNPLSILNTRLNSTPVYQTPSAGKSSPPRPLSHPPKRLPKPNGQVIW